ncbi:MAG: hypothetical protein IJ289_08010 [Clostridia bacterium]|nr:hypothetical protein [Clostridia bacterium]
MKKSEIARQFDYKATTFLLTAAIALTLNSILNNIVTNVDVSVVMNVILTAFVMIFAVFADIMTIKGFIVVNKSCKLSEDNQNYYLGKKLTVMTVVFIVVGIILTLIALFMSILIAQYEQLDVLTAEDETARMNMMILTAIVNIALQFVAISTPFIIYIWKLRGTMPAKDKLSNFALLTVLVLIVQLAIGVLNSMYIAKSTHSTFLTSFSEILLTVKYLVLTLFLFARRKSIAEAVPEEE